MRAFIYLDGVEYLVQSISWTTDGVEYVIVRNYKETKGYIESIFHNSNVQTGKTRLIGSFNEIVEADLNNLVWKESR